MSTGHFVGGAGGRAMANGGAGRCPPIMNDILPQVLRILRENFSEILERPLSAAEWHEICM